jgi:hypothetical protein
LVNVKSILSALLVGGFLSLVGSGCGSSESDDAAGGSTNSGTGGVASPLGGSPGQAGASGGKAATGGVPGAAGAATGGSPGGTSGTGGAASAGGPGVPGDTRLVDLDDAEKARFCDWYASKLGGYGHRAECAMGPRQFYADQAQCVTLAFDLDCPPITVENLAECVEAQAPSEGCDRPYEQCHWLWCQ